MLFDKGVIMFDVAELRTALTNGEFITGVDLPDVVALAGVTDGAYGAPDDIAAMAGDIAKLVTTHATEGGTQKVAYYTLDDGDSFCAIYIDADGEIENVKIS